VSIVPEIERQLREAAERMAHSPVSRAAARARRWRGQLFARPLLVGLLVVSSASGVALAARALVGVGTPAPAEYPNLDARILPAGTRLLSLRVPDPAGGPPWGMRLIFTTEDGRGSTAAGGAAHWGCVQIGRIVDGELGVLGQDGAFHDDGLFHELPAQPEGCGSLNRSGQLVGLTGGSNIETASAYQGLEGCVTETARRQQEIALPSIERELAVARTERDAQGIRAALEGLASYRRIAPKVGSEPTCAATDLRHIYFGIAGPDARSVTVTGPGVKETIPVTPADDGAYLIVQRRTQLQSMFSALKSENLALAAGLLHETVHYVNGRSCQQESAPGCLAPLGSVRVGRSGQRNPGAINTVVTGRAPAPGPETPLSRRAEHDPATPNPVTVTPRAGGPHTEFKLAFKALLNGGGYSYLILARGSRGLPNPASPPSGDAAAGGGASTRCQREAERATGGDGVAIGGEPIVRGQTITKILRPPPQGLCPGGYSIYISFSNPEPDALPNFPFATVNLVVSR
jgi:hypothetical protein